MAYPALPDRRMPYDNDGTVVYVGAPGGGFPSGPASLVSSGDLLLLNGIAGGPGNAYFSSGISYTMISAWWFFPEQREVTGVVAIWRLASGSLTVEGSNDTTNGVDGTWETATVGSGSAVTATLDAWRANVKAVSFTGPKQVIRLQGNFGGSPGLVNLHLYGHKTTGATPDDILFLDPTASDAEFTAPMDFGDRPLGSTAVATFKVQNGSATHTANTINIQCNDADFAISTDGVTYVTTINIASLASGAKSATMYVRDTAPAIGSLLGPRYARIVTTVASWT